ncbi:T9SS C-terminal target domain-containing protein [candidate division KSB1 bacterium]|nr:T9SS type A sorting domain-containing protein [candidate division KSB1 bacterium]RQW02042.1 MAG: T9SS C-terminal target domain-containing protein [candidate division KSB1 bacterium]
MLPKKNYLFCCMTAANIITLLFVALLSSLSLANEYPENLQKIIDKITVSLPQEKISYSFQDAQTASYEASSAWQSFKSDYPSWDWYWWKSGSGSPHRAFGEAIPVPGISIVTESNVEDAAWKTIEFLGEVIGVSPNELRLRRTFKVKDYWIISFYQEHQNMEVLWSEVELRLSTSGKLITFGIDTAPGLELEQPSVLYKSGSLMQAAQSGLPEEAKTNRELKIAGPFIMPVAKEKGYDYRIVYSVNTDDPDMSFPWQAWVDARTGNVLRRELAIDLVDGTVTGTVHPEVPQDTPVSRPFEHQAVDITSKPSDIVATAVTDAAGYYSATLAAGSTHGILNTSLNGPIVEINNDGGTDANYLNTVSPGETHDLVWTDARSTIAERDAFYHTNQIFEHVAAMDDAFGLSFRTDFNKLGCYVNIDDPGMRGNAGYSRTSHSMYFFLGGWLGGINWVNSATSPRTVYHEWGHGRHYEQHRMAGAIAPAPTAFKEPVADITSAFFVRDPRHSLGIGGAGYVRRNADNTYEYPDDWAALGTPHNQGQILSGALWDMRDNFIATYGTENGSILANELFHVALYGGASDAIAIVAWIEFMLDIILADDDDNNLGNGTPNFIDIRDAFQLHGIWPHVLLAGEGGIDVALVMDRSGSMGWDTEPGVDPTPRIVYTKDAAIIFSGFCDGQDRVGLTNFDHEHDPALDHPLVQMTPANRASLIAAINALTPRGATSYGTGLEAGQDILDAVTPSGIEPQFMLILGDGEENTPPWAMDVLSGLPVPDETALYTIFLGPDPLGEALLRNLALAGNGVFLQAPTAYELLATYVHMYTLIMDRDLILSYSGLVNPLLTDNTITATDTSRTIGELVHIDRRTTDVDFMGHWLPVEQGNASGMVELEDPDGVVINRNNITEYPGGSFVLLPNGENLRINQPLPGLWVMRITVTGHNIEGTKIDGFCVTTNDIDMELSSKAIDRTDRIYALQARLLDSYNVDQPVPILGATVIAERGGQKFILSDDGSIADGEKNDGIYGGIVGSVPDSTSATFNIKATFAEGNLSLSRLGQISVLHTKPVDIPTLVNKPAGWSLTSMPVWPEEPWLPNLFPNYQAVFYFDPQTGYQSVTDTLRANYTGGFWLNMADSSSGSIKGAPVTEYSVDLTKGWHILGGLYNQTTMPKANPKTAIGAIFGFDQQTGYYLTDRVKPNEAVWIECKEPCTVRMTTSFAKALAPTETAATWDATILATGEEVGSRVRVSNVVLGASNDAENTISAPPSPPEYTAQLRLFRVGDFTNAHYSDVRLVQDPVQAEIWVLEVDPNGNTPPGRTATVSWDANELKEIGDDIWELREGTDGTGAIIIPDMRAETSFDVSGTGEQYFTITALKVTGHITDLKEQDDGQKLPDRYVLFQNYPNPFNPTTDIKYQLPENSRVTLSIHNILGQEVVRLVDKNQQAGYYTVHWDGKDVATGMYLYRIQAGDFIQVKKMLLLQ